VKVVFHFDGTDTLREKLGDVVLCPESDAMGFERLLPEMEVLWHVLKPVTAEVIAKAPKLKLIQKIGSGVNTIDVEAAKRRGIAVCNLPGTNSRAVAEMTLFLMLGCLRRLPAELGGRVVGLVGYGAVPRILHPMLEAMGATVRYWSRSRQNSSLPELLEKSDVVSLHLPLTEETERLIDPRRLKRGAILVNTARGGLVQEELLAECLRSGRLAAAGLDVLTVEPAAPDNPLLALPNVIYTPHIAWLTGETLQRSLAVARENVRRLHAGEALLHRVA
jgi:phosphoglycerate dehydrogenase-like enzyme